MKRSKISKLLKTCMFKIQKGWFFWQFPFPSFTYAFICFIVGKGRVIISDMNFIFFAMNHRT